MKLGTQVLNGGALVHVGKDRDGHFFTMHSDGSGRRFRLKSSGKVLTFKMPGTRESHVAELTDPPKKPHP